MKVKLDPGAKMPTKTLQKGAGYDLYSREDAVIYHGDSYCFDTGVHVNIPAGYVGTIISDAGLYVKHNLTSEGVIHAGDTGSIMVKLYNHGNAAVGIEKGQKIAQFVIVSVITPELEQAESMEDMERGADGFDKFY